MPDTKALFTAQFDAARDAWTKKDEAAAAQFLRSAIIISRGDPALRLELASALFHLGKISQKLGQAGEAETETLLTEALTISEALFGRESPALAPLLNELGRLHFRRSHFARAADVVERLVAIARRKGEMNADVATALAGLAVVKRKLGDDASAEALYRDALRIQEKVLAPTHMTIVVTLEHLAETCVARGNFEEALALLRRALATREIALGPGHSSVHVARSRVAKLELDAATPSTTVSSSVHSRTPEFVGQSEPRLLPLAARLSERAKTPAVTASTSAPASAPVTGPAPVALLTTSLPETPSASPTVFSPRKRTTLYSSAGAAAVTIAIVGLLMLRPRAGSGREPLSTNISATPHGSDRSGLMTTRPAATPPVTPAARERTPASARPALRSPRVDLSSMNIPSMPTPPSADAILRSATEPRRAPDTNRTDTSNQSLRSPSADIVSPHTSPKIIGRVPDPGFPNELLRSGRRQGQVVVRFIVNELGRVDAASMIVERSDDDLFTEAVRDVLPLFRFEPARTLGLESRPVEAWVSVPFRFTTKNK